MRRQQYNYAVRDGKLFCFVPHLDCAGSDKGGKASLMQVWIKGFVDEYIRNM